MTLPEMVYWLTHLRHTNPASPRLPAMRRGIQRHVEEIGYYSQVQRSPEVEALRRQLRRSK